MYLQNKYQRYYCNIINYAISQNRKKINRSNNNYIYYEKHHIIPKSLDGRDIKENLVLLTAREHFICHRLLVRMTTGENKKKMIHAIWSFARSSKNQNRNYITSRKYETIRTEFSKMLSDSRKGVMNVGRIMSLDEKIHLSTINTGKNTLKKLNKK